ncbi:Uncharacterised protein [uncultured archaeon]|nr:Uncharacterised protein [uncultured archaeon]
MTGDSPWLVEKLNMYLSADGVISMPCCSPFFRLGVERSTERPGAMIAVSALLSRLSISLLTVTLILGVLPAFSGTKNTGGCFPPISNFKFRASASGISFMNSPDGRKPILLPFSSVIRILALPFCQTWMC